MANRGFTLVELLVASVVGTMLLGVSAKFIEMNLQSTNVAKALLTENDFKQTIAKGLENEGCHETDDNQASLKPDSLDTSAPNKADGIGALKSGFSLNSIKVGDFKGSIEVIKMELKGVATEPTRDFVVYYKKKDLGILNAPDASKCISTDVTGCFEQRCTVNYKNTPPGDSDPGHCTGSVDCHALGGGGGGGGGPPPCYHVDKTDSSGSEAKALVGCGGTHEPAGGTKTTAIGYSAGKVNTGAGNTFIGYKTGLENIGGAHNTFIGSESGKEVTTGSNNIAIGSNVQLKTVGADSFFSKTQSNQINIGNIIKAKSKVLKVCNKDGGECKTLKGLNAKACPPGEFVREVQEDGTIICASACSGGRRLFETLKLDGGFNYGIRTITYEVGYPEPYGDTTILSKRRSCKCRSGSNWTGEFCTTCSGNKRYVQEISGCGSCFGGGAYWYTSWSGVSQCMCPRGKVKKKVVRGIIADAQATKGGFKLIQPVCRAVEVGLIG